MSDIKIIDNFLTHQEHKNLLHTLCETEFPWFYSQVISDSDFDQFSFIADKKYNYQFCHRVYLNAVPCSNFFYLLQPFCDKLCIHALVSAKFNMNPCTENVIEHCLHVDNDIKTSAAKTAVYYLNSNDGYTFFENGDRIESVANRLVLFPTTMKHSGTTCTNTSTRMVLNLNFFA